MSGSASRIWVRCGSFSMASLSLLLHLPLLLHQLLLLRLHLQHVLGKISGMKQLRRSPVQVVASSHFLKSCTGSALRSDSCPDLWIFSHDPLGDIVTSNCNYFKPLSPFFLDKWRECRVTHTVLNENLYNCIKATHRNHTHTTIALALALAYL